MRKITLWTVACLIMVVSFFSCKGKPSVEGNELVLTPCLLATKTYLNDDPTKKALEITLNIEYPASYGDREVLNKVREAVLIDFFPEADTAYVNPLDVLNAYVKEYKQFFFDSENAYADLEEKEFVQDDPWYNYVKMLIRYNANGLLSYTIFSDCFTGGAHGGKTYLNSVFDLKKGKRITEDDLFSEEVKPFIIKMIVDSILKKHQVETVEDLEEIGFFDITEISLNKNFYINDKGITYTYNEYEIAGYAVGTTNVFLDFASLSGFLISGSPVEELMKKLRLVI